jgi:protein AbiQ
LTSAKSRHLGWANISKHNIVIYEMVDKSEIHKKDVCKRIGTTDTYKKIMAVLEIRKMIPINEYLCTFIDFESESDKEYKALLEKEYRFLKPMKDSILKKANEIYLKQKETGVIESCYCNFDILETAYQEYRSKQI